LVNVLSVLRFTYSDYPYGIFDLFLLYNNHLIKKKHLWPTITIIESGVRNREYTPTIDSER
jgi:hypothetical protein